MHLGRGWIFSSVKLNALQYYDIRGGLTHLGLYTIQGAPSRKEGHFTVKPVWQLPKHIHADKYPPLLGWSPYTAQKALRIHDAYSPRDSEAKVNTTKTKEWVLEFDDWTMVLPMPAAWPGPPHDAKPSEDVIFIPLSKEMC
jgi:hypothetical protein